MGPWALELRVLGPFFTGPEGQLVNVALHLDTVVDFWHCRFASNSQKMIETGCFDQINKKYIKTHLQISHFWLNKWWWYIMMVVMMVNDGDAINYRWKNSIHHPRWERGCWLGNNCCSQSFWILGQTFGPCSCTSLVQHRQTRSEAHEVGGCHWKYGQRQANQGVSRLWHSECHPSFVPSCRLGRAHGYRNER